MRDYIMLGEKDFSRSFKGGGWDLRRNERRHAQINISFDDRRKIERRLTAKESQVQSAPNVLYWVDKSWLDE